MALMLSACDNKSSKSPPRAAPDDYRLFAKHDEIDGDSMIARKSFINSQGSVARVALTCAADTKSDIFAALAGLKDHLASNTVGSLLGMQTGCPPSLQCGAVATVEFFNGDNAVAPTTVSVPIRRFHSIIVPYQGKDLASGKIYKATTTLMRDGTQYRANAVQIPLPTAGAALTKWLLRFRLNGFDRPIDVWVDHQSPNLSRFFAYCNEKQQAAAQRAPHQTDTPSAQP